MKYEELKLLDEGSFEKYLSCNTWWIPINTLGKRTIYAWEDYEKILELPVEDRRKKVTTLFDAIQLFVVSDFQEALGVTHRLIGGISWEFYQSGLESVIKNSGCCSSCSAWLCYILEGKYDEVGMLAIARYNMSGHCINYIRHEGKLYFVDMQTFLRKYLSMSTPETGSIKDFRKTRYITNLFVRADSFEDYAKFHRRMMRNVVKDFLFIKIHGNQCMPIGSKDGDINTIYLPKGYSFEMISSNHPCGMKYELIEMEII